MSSRYRLLITGKNPDYFLRELIKRKINIYDLLREDRKIFIVVDVNDYLKIKEIKTSYKIEIVERIGLCKYQYLLRKYAFFLFFFGIGILVNLFLSNIIFDVEVIHSNLEIKELVKRDLEEFGIEKFHFKVSFDKKEEIRDAILKKEVDDLEWLEIEEVGTKYVVKVEQRKKNKQKEECKPRNIIAKKKAMILEIEADEGEVVKKKLDYVSKGDVLVSGFIHNKEEVVSKKCASGVVFGEVWYKVDLSLPKRYHEEKVTGRRMRQVEIQFLNHEYQLFHTFKTYQKKVVPILDSRLLPLKIQVGSYLETEVIDKKYSVDSINDEALKIADKKLKNRLSDNSKILSKKVLKKYEKDSKIIVEIFVKVKEDITEYQDITDIDINELNKKEE